MIVLLTLTTAGTDSGPYNLYSDVDGYTTAFETAVDKTSLLAGYSSNNAPALTTTVQIKSTGSCTNSINVILA